MPSELGSLKGRNLLYNDALSQRKGASRNCEDGPDLLQVLMSQVQVTTAHPQLVIKSAPEELPVSLILDTQALTITVPTVLVFTPSLALPMLRYLRTEAWTSFGK